MNHEAFGRALGIDIGSTTIKYVLLDERGAEIASAYRRHKSAVRETLDAMLAELAARPDCGAEVPAAVAFTGSGAMKTAEMLGLPFVQEVICAARWLRTYAPDVDCAVELGGEDAKLLYLKQSPELRMNEACAGGTGAFIDRMAGLLDTDAAGLDRLAQTAACSHPIASRCGVFAKTDVVNLLNTGVPRGEIARSIFDAVAEQTVGGLACGRPLRGVVAFLGGPLGFMPALKDAFMRRLGSLNTYPDLHGGELAVAAGAALSTHENPAAERLTLAQLRARLAALPAFSSTASLPPLFADDAERLEFGTRHVRECAARAPLETASGDAYLGIDLGSTTVKAVLMDGQRRILWSTYEQNDGRPLERLSAALVSLLERLPEAARIRSICTTGYGARIAQAATGAPFTEVETLAHQRGAAAFEPRVSYVIDIGGQDMKCIAVRDGLITNMALNEACSSGCGSFLQTFAAQLGLTMNAFVAAALNAEHPCDLGSRCTVFMNSRVRQAQRDGAAVGDIAAGLCRSIVRNALHKVLRIRDPKELGEHVVVQGGAFLNMAVLRAFELETGLRVVRPDVAGLMGAYGAALIAMERTTADTPAPGLSRASLDFSDVVERSTRCHGCGNRCPLRITRFPSGERCVSGSRCDFGNNRGGLLEKHPGWAEEKAALLFERPVRAAGDAPRGVIGIPRALNAWEHYPYWHALFTKLGFRVVLSSPEGGPASSDNVPSQNLCHPAKLAHRHVEGLARSGVHRIWMPCIPLEGRPLPEAQARFACPVAGNYAEALKLNLPEGADIRLITPFLDPAHPDTVVRALREAFPGIEDDEAAGAVEAAGRAQHEYHQALKAKAEAVISEARARRQPVVVLAGHPYHMDPQINHGIPGLIESMGAALITEDAAAMIAPEPRGLEVLNQWTFHSRLYRAAELVVSNPDFELVQLVSFGCGLDAVTSDQVRRLLNSSGRLATMLKIDEGEALGSARIRLRSLLAAVADRRTREADGTAKGSPAFSPSEPSPAPARRIRSEGRTIYAPQMAPIHFPIIAAAARSIGWRIEILPEVTPRAIELGLRYVNNDACYPAVVVIGQMLEKVLDDPDFERSGSALLLTQTCGPCRASNYLTLLRWALRDCGHPDVPVLSLSAGGAHDDYHLSVGLRGLVRLIRAVAWGDMLQRLVLHVRAHEVEKGSADRLLAFWSERARSEVAHAGRMGSGFRRMVHDFMSVPMTREPKPRIGIVGEILLKYHPAANLDLVSDILHEGCEPVQGDITAFLLYSLHDAVWKAQALDESKAEALKSRLLIAWLERVRGLMRRALAGTPLEAVPTLSEMLSHAETLVSPGQQAGEGWLLTSEMDELARSGAAGVVCVEPFGCLPNHVTGKGVMRELRRRMPHTSFCALDYDAGTSHANAGNRLKLFLAQARRNSAARADAVRSLEAMTTTAGPEGAAEPEAGDAVRRIIGIAPSGAPAAPLPQSREP